MVQLILPKLHNFFIGHIQWHLQPLKYNSHGTNSLINQRECQLDHNYLNILCFNDNLSETNYV